MLLELPPRNQEKSHHADRSVVQRIKLNPSLRPAKRPSHFGNQIRRRVRQTNPKPNSRTHGGLALLHRCTQRIHVFGLNLPDDDEMADEFVDSLPAILRSKANDDWLRAE